MDTTITAGDLTVLITIHGMGFQHAPKDGSEGYADRLHGALERVAPRLEGDPVAEFGRPAGTGAVYVHSEWPPGSGQVTEGLKRLGHWAEDDPGHRRLDITGVPLAAQDGAVAHVALVYAGLEEDQPHPGAALDTLARAVISHGHYGSAFTLIGIGLHDTWAALTHHAHGNNDPTPSLMVRATPPTSGDAGGTAQSTSTHGTIGQIDRDVTTYICRNDLRERVRGFVHEAILRICSRPDVAHVVVNAHSLGTVVAYDVVRELPPFAIGKVRHLVTAGSPLRKFADIFYWGTDAGPLTAVPWTNAWDATDPVADPLVPDRNWQPGTGPHFTGPPSDFFAGTDPDTGTAQPAQITDLPTSNIDGGAGGSLPAHNYWDNTAEFVPALGEIIESDH